MSSTYLGSRTIAIAAIIALAIVGCGGGGGGGGGNTPPPPPPTPAAPTISVDAPTAPVNRTVPLSATVDAPDGVTVTSVEFLVDGASVGTANADPFTVDWDSSTVSDGDHEVTARATDDTDRVVTSDPVTITVMNNLVIHVELSSAQTLPAVDSDATGAGDITVNLVSGEVTGGVTVEGVTATLAHIHRGFAGVNGPVVVDFAADPADPTRWDAVEGATLTEEDIENLLTGALYVNVHTEANPAGEIRGQLQPENIVVVFSTMSEEQVVPPAPDAASGTIATTIDTAASTATVHAITSTLVEPNAAHVHIADAGANATDVLFELAQSDTDPNHWLIERQDVTAEQLEAFDANQWYVDVHTAGLPDGAVRGQILVNDEPAPPAAATLSELQASVFTPICSGCHTGGGESLPSAMNLSNAEASFASLVGVASIQQSTLDRVSPGDADNSYLIHKIEGAPSITGARMPFGGPPLDQETIDRMRSWIDAGALNN
jgi:hypothetical protein